MSVSGRQFGMIAGEYATHRVGFPASFFDRLFTYGVGLEGQRVVDLGAGTGTLARNSALRGCAVIGVDIDARTLAQARRLDATFTTSIALQRRPDSRIVSRT